MVEPSGAGRRAASFSYPWQFQSRRSPVMATDGMVATSHPLAAQAGLAVLQDGGNAADAAIACAAVLNVVEPGMTGIGGDAFALTHFDGEYAGLNGSGPAPADATIETYRDRTTETEDGDPVLPATGGLPVTVPGALDAWQRLLHRYGTRSLGDLLQPAIRYAREGVPVPPHVADWWRLSAPKLAAVPASRETYLPENRAPEPGERFRNPAIAETFERIAGEGPAAFYDGPIGAEIVDIVREHGGELTMADLRAYESEWTEPIVTEFRGLEVLEHPPNGQGAVALEALNVAATFDLPTEPTHPDRVHHLIEAVKIGFADGYAHLTDPDYHDIPLDTILDKEYAARRAEDVAHRASTYGPRARGYPPGDETAYLSVVDGDGNAVSFINSLYMAFGSGLTAGGVAIQNRGHSFSLDPDHANALAPGKRPFHTIIPAMLRDPDDGSFRASWGVMGGSMQPQGHVQVLARLADGADPQTALDAPRFRWLEGRRVALESDRMPEATVTALRNRGHRIETEPEVHFGGGQLIYRDPDGTLLGGSDPRKDGHAAGY